MAVTRDVPDRDAELVVRARGLRVQYGPLRALDGVDLDIYRGEVVALAGENGAGKSTLVRCLAADISPAAGSVAINGRPLGADPHSAAQLGVAVVWQDLALCDNLDIAANLLLGRESRFMMFAGARFHARASELLHDLGISLPDTGTLVGDLSGGQRQLVAVARAMRDHPQVLVLDEPTASLGVFESAQVEELTATLPGQGTTVLLVSHDVEQMFRLADRIVVLRHGRTVAEVEPSRSHPDEISALLSGQAPDGSARRQLSRLHNLADQLASAEPSSSLDLILSALGSALGNDRLCIHVGEGATLRMAGSIGLPPKLADAWAVLPNGAAGGQIGRSLSSGGPVVSTDVRTATGWAHYPIDARVAGFRSSWSVPFTGARGMTGVVTVISRDSGEPTRDDLNLVTLYAGYAASAIERDRLLGELTVRNRVLETIRDVLETLAGPIPFEQGLDVALRALQAGLGASEVGLLTSSERGELTNRGWVGSPACTDGPSDDLLHSVRNALEGDAPAVKPRRSQSDGAWAVAVAFPAPDGTAVLAATWRAAESLPDHGALVEDAANSLRLALEREESERAQREAMALRSSQELQRQFLSWLSHELRTPLTAIRGYASSLMQPDVDWDGGSQRRFLERISDESARLGRLVGDLLDFSAIDAGILRLHPDWCDLALVLEAARACLPEAASSQVALLNSRDVPVIWADHDRLEQLFVNLLENAVRHNPPGTKVTAEAIRDPGGGTVTVYVSDDGLGVPEGIASGQPAGKAQRRSRSAGAGLGLSIARGIVDAHGGSFELVRLPRGTRCGVSLPVALGAPAADITSEA